MKRFHIALSVTDIQQSVAEYSYRLGEQPAVVMPNEYALWRTDTLNFSIRQSPEQSGMLRHLGWEDDATSGLSVQQDGNGIAWEYFNQAAQMGEIQRFWPDAIKTFEHYEGQER